MTPQANARWDEGLLNAWASSWEGMRHFFNTLSKRKICQDLKIIRGQHLLGSKPFRILVFLVVGPIQIPPQFQKKHWHVSNSDPKMLLAFLFHPRPPLARFATETQLPGLAQCFGQIEDPVEPGVDLAGPGARVAFFCCATRSPSCALSLPFLWGEGFRH